MSFVNIKIAIHKETKQKISSVSPFPIDQEIKKSFDPVVNNWEIKDDLIWS